MNKHLYRLVWRRCRVDVVPAPETARQSAGAPVTRGHRVRRSVRGAAPFATSLSLTRVCLACIALLGAALPASTWAACTTVGSVVTCSGAANPLAPSYASSANNLQVNVNSGASVGVLLGVGGTAMSLTGTNVTLVNGGTVDPSLLGGIGLLASGTVVGNGSAGGSTQTVTNNAIMRGTVGVLGVNLPGLTGMALTVQNATGGTTTINNGGTLGATPILGVSLTGNGSAPVAAAYGGAAINFTNTGTVLGRIAFAPNGTAGAGNTFSNQGTLSGSVSLGAGSTNTFTAVTGSTFNDGGSVGIGALPVVGFNLGFAATGVIDGGAGGNNSLVLRNVANDATATGTGTLNGASYVNFSSATMNGGTWTLSGPLAVTSTALNGGLAIFDNAGSFGTGSLTFNGGAVQAASAGLTIALAATLGANGLSVSGALPLTLGNTISGTGGLSLTGTGSLTLSGTNTYSGGTLLSGGTLIAGSSGALGSAAVQVSGATGVLDANASRTLANPIVIGSGSTLTLGGSAPLTLAGQISGSGSLAKQGAQTVTLTGANTFSGSVNVMAGTLALSGAGTLQSGGMPLSLSGAGAVFDISNANVDVTITGLSGVANTQIALGSRTLTLGSGAGSLFAGTISGTGGIVKQGTGSLLLTGAQTFTGGIDITAGQLSVQANNALAGSNVVTLADGATFDIGSAGPIGIGSLIGTANSQVTLGANTLTLGDAASATFAGSLGGTGGIVKQGTGTQTLTGQNAFTGQINVNAGTLALGGTGTLSANSVDIAGGAVLDISNGENQTISALSGAAGSAILLGDNTLSFGDGSNQTFAGTLTGNGGGIVKFGAGTQTITAQQTFTGSVVIGGGALVIGAGGGLSSQSAVVLGNSSTSLDISAAGSQTIGALSGGAAQVQLRANQLTFGDATDQTLAASFSGTGGIVKQGTGTETLTGSQTFTGAIGIVDGTLALGGGASLQSANTVTLSGANSVFDISGGAASTIGALTGVAGSAISLGAQTLTLSNVADATFSGTIHGSGALVVSGPAVQTLSGASDFSGGISVGSGGLVVGNDLALGSGAATFGNNVTLDSTQAVTLGNNAALLGTLTVLGSHDLTLNGALSGVGGLTKDGTATLTLGGGNTFTGPTTINAGTLALGAGASLNGAGAINVASGATLDLSAGNGTQVIGTVNGAGTVNMGALVTEIGSASNGTFSGSLTGTGSVIKVGTGTETLTGQSAFTGGTVVQAGTLALSGAGALASSGAVTLSNAGSTFDISGANGPRTIGALSADAGTQIALGSNTLTFGDATSHTVAAVVGGSGGIIKQGTGTTTLLGLQQYTGATTIADGTLALGATGNLGAGAVVSLTGQGAVFDLSAAGNQSLAHLSGTGGSVVLGGGNSLTVGNNDVSTLASAISGTGALIMDGSGKLTLTAQNTFAGGIAVNSGTLALGAGGTLAGTNDVTLVSGATFDASAATAPVIGSLSGATGSTVSAGTQTLTLGGTSNTTFSGALNGTGLVVKQGTGTQTFDGGTALTTDIRISAGTLALRNGTQLGGKNVVLDGVSAALDISTGPNQTAATLAGVAGSAINLGGTALTLTNAAGSVLASNVHGVGGSLVKLGNGVQTLAGNNDFTGGVDVQAGGVSVGSNTALGTGTVHFADSTSLDATQATMLGNQITLGGNLNVAGSNGLTLNGVITGAGGLTKNGGATLTLNGQNTYAGATNINAGTLALGASGQLAGGANVVLTGSTATFDIAGAGNRTLGTLAGTGGTVNLGGNTLTFGGGSNQALGAAIVGTGGIVKTGAGTQTLTGQSGFSGGIDVAGGTLAIGAGGTLSGLNDITLATGTALDISSATSSPITIKGLTGSSGTTVSLGNQSLALGGAADSVFDGVITGTGGITKLGNATVTLGGNNSYTGGTTVNGGGVTVTSPTGLGTGGLTVSQGNVTTQGVNVVLPTLNGTSQGGLTLNGGSVAVAAGSFPGSISGSGGLTKTGSGTLTIGAQNPLTGPTTVAGGTLNIGGLANSPVTVQTGATLATPAPPSSGGSGVGAQTGPLTGASGSQIVVTAPGSTLSVGGNLTLAPGSTLQVNVAPGTPPSQVDASGSATVGGSNLVVNAAPGTQPADASGAVIVSAPGGVSGQFASASTNLLYLTPQVSYSATSVLLTFAPNGTPLPAGAVTPNQRAVASAVSALGTGSTLYQAALGLTAASAPAAFGSLDGSLHASITSMLLGQTQIARDAVSLRLRESLSLAMDCEAQSFGGSAASSNATSLDRDDCRAQPRATQAWASVYGNDGQMRDKAVADGGSGASTLHRRGMGLLAGVDAPLADAWRAGAFGGLGHSTFNTGASASGNSNDAQIGAYVNRRFGHLGATLGGAYGWQQISSQRAVAIGPITQTARASYNASVWQVFGEAAWRVDVGRASVEPFANVAYARVRTDAFDESGSVAALHADEQTQGITFSTAGLRGEVAFGTGVAASGRLRVSAGWRHAYGADVSDMRLAFSGTSAGFTVGGVPIARDAAVVSAGVDAFVGNAVTLGVSYTGQFSGQLSDNAVYGNVTWRF